MKQHQQTDDGVRKQVVREKMREICRNVEKGYQEQMRITEIFKRKSENPLQETFSERTFECQRDNLTIRGTEYLPAGAQENLPVAIVCHGFMANQDSVKHYAKVLAEVGYATYCFDFCGGSAVGTGKSDGLTTEMSVLTEVKDLEAVIEYTQSLPYNGDRLLLMGGSQGGFVSALTAAKHPEKVFRLVLIFPAFCIPDDARAGKMMFAKFDPADIPETINCGPMKLGKCYPADVLDMDPIKEVSAYGGPVLIVHGTKDKIVDLKYSQEAQAAYPRAVLKIIKNGGHGFSKKQDMVVFEYLKKFAALKR